LKNSRRHRDTHDLAVPHSQTSTKPVPTRLPIERKVALAMQVVVTVAVPGFALYVIASKSYGDDAEKRAYGIVGALLMFWLKDSLPRGSDE
jgi:hypothetical protein